MSLWFPQRCICGHPPVTPLDGVDLSELRSALDDLRERRLKLALEAVDDPRVLDELPGLSEQEEELRRQVEVRAYAVRH